MPSSPASTFRILPASERDVPVILELIRGLADFERLGHEVVANEELLRESLFGGRADAEVVIAWAGEEEAAGFALFFHNYSTFLARRGLFLEDLFVRPQFRGRGLGRQLLAHLAALAVERRCGRFEWNVLDWNEGAIRFYRSVGAEPMSDWTTYRVTGAALIELAGSQSGRNGNLP